jgi:selenocysteine-specific elongation factor
VIAVDDELEVVRLARRVRVRGIETAHRHVDRVAPGTRVALNLAGIEHRLLTRGDALVRPGQWTAATTVDVAVVALPGEVLAPRARLQAYAGSGEHEVRFRALDEAGRFARLRLDSPLPVAPGDRMVLRDPGRERTVAGAEVLDTEPTGKAADAPAVLALPMGPRLLAGHGWISRADVPRLAGLGDDAADALARSMIESGAAAATGGGLVAPAALAELRARAEERVHAHHGDHPLDAGIELGALAGALRVDTARLRAALVDDPALVVEQGLVRDAGRRARASDSPSARTLIDELDASPFAPPAPSDVALARALVRDGVLVDIDGVVFTANAVDRARTLIRDALRERDALSIADVRELLGSSRKYILPLLGRFDSEGITRRRGDDRVAGPAAFRDQL